MDEVIGIMERRREIEQEQMQLTKELKDINKRLKVVLFEGGNDAYMSVDYRALERLMRKLDRVK